MSRNSLRPLFQTVLSDIRGQSSDWVCRMLALRDISSKRGLKHVERCTIQFRVAMQLSPLKPIQQFCNSQLCNITGDKCWLPLGVLRVRPKEIAHGSIVGNFLLSVDCPKIQHVYQESL